MTTIASIGSDQSSSTATPLQRAGRSIQRSGRTLAFLVAVAAGLGANTAFAQTDSTININLATPEVLSEGLVGVGIAKAYRIVEYREAHGPFEAVEELAEVNGIGPSTVDRNRERIVLE